MEFATAKSHGLSWSSLWKWPVGGIRWDTIFRRRGVVAPGFGSGTASTGVSGAAWQRYAGGTRTMHYLNLFIDLSKYIYLFKYMIGLRSFLGDIWFSIATYFWCTHLGTTRAYQVSNTGHDLHDLTTGMIMDDHGWSPCHMMLFIEPHLPKIYPVYPPFSGLQCSTWDVKYVKCHWKKHQHGSKFWLNDPDEEFLNIKKHLGWEHNVFHLDSLKRPTTSDGFIECVSKFSPIPKLPPELALRKHVLATSTTHWIWDGSS